MAETVRRHSCELLSTLALSTEHNRRERLSARENANVAMRSISRVEYDSVSQARSSPFSVTLPRSPKYIPPASSRTISMSRSPKRSGFNGDIPRSGSRTLTGRTFTYRPIPLRRSSSPLSGRFPTGSASHFGPPTAPRNTASALRQASSVSLGSGVPAASMAAPPIRNSANSNWWLNSCADSRKMAAAARVTSGPMPSPGNRTMLFFIVIPEHKQHPGTPRSLQEDAKWRVPRVAISLAADRSGCRRRFRGQCRRTPSNHFVGDGDDVSRAHLLSLIGQRRHPAVNFRKFGIARLVTQVAERQPQRVAPGVLSEDQRARRHADCLGRNNLVGQRVLDDSVLVNSGFVRERVRAHNRFVRRHLCSRDLGEHAARGEKLLEPNARRNPEAVLAYRQRHDYFFQGSVSRAFADSVDRALDLPHARANRRQRVRHRHAQVVVAMRAERNALRIPQVFTDSGEHRSVLFRHRISHRVRQIQDRCARIHRHTAYLAQKIDIGSPGILGGELHFPHMLPTVANHRADGFERLLPGHVQLHTKVQIGGREEDMQAWRGRRFQSLYSGAYIFLLGACECRDRNRSNFLRHFLNRFQVTPRRNRETRFDHVYLQRRKLPRQANLLRGVHREPRRLFAVTERCVKDAYDIHIVPHALVTHGRHPAVQFIFILLLIISPYTDKRRASWISVNCRY